jgi:hypothetical protein
MHLTFDSVNSPKRLWSPTWNHKEAAGTLDDSNFLRLVWKIEVKERV